MTRKRTKRSGTGRGDRKRTRTIERTRSRPRELVATPELGPFDRRRLMDLLSEFLQHERSAVELYELGLEKDLSEEQRERIEEFLEQTRRHVDILSTIISALGGDKDLLSPEAELDREKSRVLVEADTEGPAATLNFFQSLMIAELVDHQNWAFLEKAVSRVDDEEVAAVLEGHVESIEDEEDEHFRWARKQVADLSFQWVFPTPLEPPESSREAA